MIREANTSDAARIVRIHLNSWRSTYSNVFPKEVFDKQESEYNTRVENIKNAIEKGSSNYALLEEDNMVKAFICYGDARMPSTENRTALPLTTTKTVPG